MYQKFKIQFSDTHRSADREAHRQTYKHTDIDIDRDTHRQKTNTQIDYQHTETNTKTCRYVKHSLRVQPTAQYIHKIDTPYLQGKSDFHDSKKNSHINMTQTYHHTKKNGWVGRVSEISSINQNFEGTLSIFSSGYFNP